MHRFVLKFRPIIIAINIVFCLLFVALRVWPLVGLHLLLAFLHYGMMLWDARHDNQFAVMTPWLWLVYLLQFLVTVLVIGPRAGFQYYMIATIPALFSSGKWPLAAKIGQTAVITLFYIACDVLLAAWQPPYPLHPASESLLRELNIIGTCATTAAISYLLRNDKSARQYVKRGRWLLLRNPGNVPADQAPKLTELLAANQAVMVVYVMTASLKELWQPTDPWRWRAAWRTWQSMALSSAIEPLVRFAKRLALYWRGILARMRWPMHTGQPEGINNRIKVMKRMAYGYCDSEFFFLKIKAAFPGNP